MTTRDAVPPERVGRDGRTEETTVDEGQATLLPYRLRTVRVGVQITLPTLVLLAVYPLMSSSADLHGRAYYAIIGAAFVGVAVVAVLPWERLFRSGYGVAAQYTWSVADILLVTAATGVSGGATSPLWAVYVLTTVFFAASYPVRGQVALLVFTAVSYVGVALATTGTAGIGDVALRVGLLAMVTGMASFLSQELMREMSDSAAEREISDRRAHLLEQVSSAARNIHALDLDDVLAALVDAAGALGFDLAGIAMVDRADGTYRVVEARGLPSGFDRPLPLDDRIMGPVVRSGHTMCFAADQLSEAAIPLDVLIACPVIVRGEVIAVLGGGAPERGPLADEEVEAFELLAALAGRALENARLFEVERRTVERLEALDRLKSDFVSNVSHELRTPLTVIKGMGSALSTRWRDLDGDRMDTMLNRLVANADGLNRTIMTLLDWSRLEQGRLESRPEKVDVSTLLCSTTERLVDVLGRRQLRVSVDAGLDAHADPLLMERVFENLVVNAATHTPEGTTVEVNAHRNGCGVVVEVADDGPGIPTDELAHLTDRFYRGGDPNTRSTRGLGLGLALVDEILSLHHTELEVASEPGHGARFSFRLPDLESEVSAAT